MSHLVIARVKLDMLLKIIICQILLIVICAEKQCDLYNLKLQVSRKIYEKIRFDHDVTVGLYIRHLIINLAAYILIVESQQQV